MRLLRLVSCVLCCAALTACGNKGPLVMPDSAHPQPAQAPAPAGRADAATR